jgi:hypothetical protein
MSRKKIAAVVAGVGVLAAAAGVAYAAWTSGATGSATAQSTTSIASVIAPGTSLPDLYPGAAKTVTVTISNPNDYPVVVNSISAGTSGATGAGSACLAGTVTTDSRTLDATGLLQSDNTTKIIAGTASGTYTLGTHMAPTAVDACKSQTFTMSGMTATLTSAAS